MRGKTREGLWPGWAKVLISLMVTCLLAAGAWAVWSAASKRVADTSRADDAKVAVFTAAVNDRGWQVSGAATNGDTISGSVVFGDCQLRATAPYGNPSDVTVTIPVQSPMSPIKRKLADTPFDEFKRNRGNYPTLWPCFMEPIPGQGDPVVSATPAA